MSHAITTATDRFCPLRQWTNTWQQGVSARSLKADEASHAEECEDKGEGPGQGVGSGSRLETVPRQARLAPRGPLLSKERKRLVHEPTELLLELRVPSVQEQDPELAPEQGYEVCKVARHLGNRRKEVWYAQFEPGYGTDVVERHLWDPQDATHSCSSKKCCAMVVCKEAPEEDARFDNVERCVEVDPGLLSPSLCLIIIDISHIFMHQSMFHSLSAPSSFFPVGRETRRGY